MILPEFGHFALILAFGLAILLAVVPLIGAWLGDRLWMQMARPFTGLMTLLILLSFITLTLAFLKDDFSVAYVAGHSNSLLPWYYKMSAVWGGHEGSLLLWALILAGWTFAVSRFSKALPEDMVARVLGILGIVNAGFLSFIIIKSSPFERILPNIPPDGADLNPLLQDFGLIVHPPLLYMGYVGFSVAFAFALAALLGGKLDAAWARWSRPWTTVAWAFLTLGIALGSWWAYYELGWGGWWFWDPVENASLMPWLAGTALMHSLAVTEKRGLFKSWTVLLAIFTFSLSLLGTFLVRSGILTSVHAFASDPDRGFYILALLAVTIGGSLLLYALRAPVVKSRIGFSERSRETFLLMNNIILVTATLTVLGGTLFPLFAEMAGKEVSVGAPYFDAMFSFLTPLLVAFLCVGIFSHWKDTRPGLLKRQIPVPLIAAIPFAFLIPMTQGDLAFMPVLGSFLAVWLLFATIRDISQKVSGRRSLWAGWMKTRRSYKGMVFGHLGLAVMIMGAALVSAYTIEKDVRMAPGDEATLGGLVYRFERLAHYEGPNFISDRAYFVVSSDSGRQIADLHAEKRRYVVSGSIMTEAGIQAGFFRDLYVSLGEPLPGQDAWAVRLHIKPFVRWLWLGALLMAIGGALAVADPRYRQKARAKAPASAGDAEAGNTAVSVQEGGQA